MAAHQPTRDAYTEKVAPENWRHRDVFCYLLAKRWLLRASAKPEQSAKNTLLQRAIKWFEKARLLRYEPAICALISIANSGETEFYGRNELPLLYRDLHDTGDWEAGELFARALEAGEHIPRNVERSNDLYRKLFKRLIRAAASGDRSAMYRVGCYYADGRCSLRNIRRTQGAELHRRWRLALYWWLKAAGARRLGLNPAEQDFVPPFDELSLSAVCAVADLFQWGKGVPRDTERAEILFSLAAKHGSALARLQAIQTDMRRGLMWTGHGEKTYGEKLLIGAHAELTKLTAESCCAAYMEAAKWFYWNKVQPPQGDNDCDISAVNWPSEEPLWCDYFKHLTDASEAQSVTALLIRALRMITQPLDFTEQRRSKSAGPDIVETARELWRRAMHYGHKPHVSEQDLFCNILRLHQVHDMMQRIIDLQGDNIADLNIELERHEEKSSSYCPQVISLAAATFLLKCIIDGRQKCDQPFLDWVALRYQLARLEHDPHACEWRRTLIVGQIYSDAVQAAVPWVPKTRTKLVEATAVIAERASTLTSSVVDAALDRLLRSMKSLPKELTEQREHQKQQLEYNALARAVFRSTQDIGIQYNELHQRLRTPIPWRRRSNDERLRGWRQVDAIRLSRSGYEVEGIRSEPNELPYILEDDIDVIMCCQYIEKADQSLSLEPLFERGSTDLLSCQFLKKVWSPEWISETVFGKSLYYSDYLLALDESGRDVVSLHHAAESALLTAEDTRAWTLPEPWRTARQVGGVTTTASGRVMLTPLSMYWKESKQPTQREYDAGRIAIPRVNSGVVGADISVHPRSSYEDRCVGENNLRFYHARYAAILTQYYEQMGEAFPIYHRMRELHAINAGIYAARVKHKLDLAEPLRKKLERVKAGYIEARKHRLENGGVDVVIRGS